MEISLTIKLDESTDITLTEEQARSLHMKLEELFGKKLGWRDPYVPSYPTVPIQPWYTNPTPDYTQYPIITCNTDGKAKIDVPFMQEVKPFSKEDMVKIKEELESKTTTNSTETTWTNANDIKFDSGPRTVDWSYYGNTRMESFPCK